MIEERTRPLTAAERKALENMRRSPSTGGAPFAALLTFIVTSGVGLILLPASWETGAPSLVPIAVAALASGSVYVRMRRSQRESPYLRNMSRDLAEGIARLTTYQVVDAIRVEEAEDEGSQYYLKLVDGRIVFLAGQYLYELEENGSFPSRVVTVTRAPHTAVVLDAASEGAAFAPSGTRPPFGQEDYRRGGVPEDGALVDVDFEALKRPHRT